jgi:hypothetical protein
MVHTTFLALLIASTLVWFVPRLFLMHSEELSGEELIRADPRLTWIGKGYPFLLVLWCLFLASVYIALGIWVRDRVGSRVYLLLTAWSAGVAVLDGLVAVRAGVYPMPTRLTYRYVYEDGARLRRIGVFQIAFGLVVTVAAIFLVLVVPEVF